MDIARLRREAEDGVWVPIEGSDAEVLLRRIDDKETKQLRAKARRGKLGGRRRKKGDLDMELFSELLLDACVRDWKKVVDGDKPLQVTLENKSYLDAVWPEFSSAWNDFLSESSEEVEGAREEELGNSPSGPSGSTPPSDGP